VLPGRALRFPQDSGAHPEFRTEWWYLTGTLQLPGAAHPHGFQITFFRSRVDADVAQGSRFATRQLLFAHAALTDLGEGRLRHDERIARQGFGIAEAKEGDTEVKLRDWRLSRRDDVSGAAQQSVYAAQLKAQGFGFDLQFTETQPLILQGKAGYSQKGPSPSQASHYYSKPHLTVAGRLQTGGKTHTVQGTAWLDHEWSEALLHPDAVGWDWIGMNLHDGGALTAFRLRRRDGSTLWTGGSWRTPKGQQTDLQGRLAWTPLRWWESPLTKARYPVVWQVATPAGRFVVQSRLDAQELDSRASTGTVYWEGLSELLDERGQAVGQGYLEMTGYAGALRL
jgi:predicted secreted hydrolase